MTEIKNEQDEAIRKEIKQKEKTGNTVPIQQFLNPAGIEKNVTKKSAAALSTKAKFAEEEGSSSNQRLGSRLNEPVEGNEDKFLDADTNNEMILNPAKYILKVDTNSDPGAIDDFCDDIQYLDEKKEIAPDNVEPLYEELKKIYDWNEDETKVKPRIKGDQRMYHESYDKVDSIDRIAGEPFKDQVEPPQVHDDPTKTFVSSPNLSPLLLVYTGSGKSEIGERTISNKLLARLTFFRSINLESQVSGVRNGGAKGKDAVSWSLTGQKQYIDTDSRSPYENRKYLESQVPRGWEHVQNIDRVKQTIVSSKDLHESFVEPLEWIDDFDKDIRVRLSRSLKTVDSNTLAYIESSTTKYEKSPVNGFIDRAPIENGTTLKTEDSKVALVTHPPLDIQQLFQDDRRTKREVGTLYDTYDDDEDRRNRDSERMDYDLYSSDKEKTSDNFQLLNSYDDTDDENQELFNSKDVEEYDYLDDDEDDYGGIVRNADSKRKEHAVKKKSYGKALKKKKKEGHAAKSNKNRRKRRHRKNKKMTTKKRGKKHKKGTSKNGNRHTNIKKSKITQDEEKAHNEGKKHHDRIKEEDTMNLDNDIQRKKFSTLLVADNVEDESQMDSALHGELAAKIVEQIFDQVFNIFYRNRHAQSIYYISMKSSDTKERGPEGIVRPRSLSQTQS
ncbi:uncharacterized protein [Bombus fervidus]|uniref:uncharacterized protein n=1 Tax=Bombus fervidus TaxID=203811 RepID=UPI003AB39D80